MPKETFQAEGIPFCSKVKNRKAQVIKNRGVDVTAGHPVVLLDRAYRGTATDR